MTKLFTDFTTVKANEWKQKIQFELKGLDYNETLVWKSPEEINVKPFYTPEDTVQKNLIFTPSTCKIVTEAPFEASKILVITQEDLITNKYNLLENNDLELFIQFNNPIEQYPLLDPKKLKNNYLAIDVISNLAATGNWYKSEKEDTDWLKKLIENNNEAKKCIGINANLYQNAGANIVQQLALALAHANEYYNLLGEKAIEKVYFNFAIGANYFFEIAKLKAFRILHQLLITEYNSTEEAFIFCENSQRNKSLLDEENNLIRTTFEGAAAIIGGSDALLLHAFTETEDKKDFAVELAYKQQILLLEEASFNKMNAPAQGSYYIETITSQLVEKALELFKFIEAKGGLIKGLQNGAIQKLINDSAENEQKAFDEEKEILVGVNKYKHAVVNKQTKQKIIATKVLFPPIKLKRIAEKFELG